MHEDGIGATYGHIFLQKHSSSTKIVNKSYLKKKKLIWKNGTRVFGKKKFYFSIFSGLRQCRSPARGGTSWPQHYYRSFRWCPPFLEWDIPAPDIGEGPRPGFSSSRMSGSSVFGWSDPWKTGKILRLWDSYMNPIQIDTKQTFLTFFFKRIYETGNLKSGFANPDKRICQSGFVRIPDSRILIYKGFVLC